MPRLTPTPNAAALPAHVGYHRAPPSGATVRCEKLRDIAQVDADAMRALRLGGKLTAGSQSFHVRLADKDGTPAYQVKMFTGPHGTGKAAPDMAVIESAVAAMLQRRHLELVVPPQRFGSDREVVALCRAFAHSTDLHNPAFKRLLEHCVSGGAPVRLYYGGRYHAVQVKPGPNGMADAKATLVPDGFTGGALARLIRTVRNLFPHASAPVSIHSLETHLTAAIRQHEASKAQPWKPASEQTRQARVDAAIQAAGMARKSGVDIVPDLTNAHLAGLTLTERFLEGAKMQGANLASAALDFAKLAKADLTGANLHDASLRFANLERACLCEADLSNADLTSADLKNADLSDANMTKAKLDAALLTNTTLRNAVLANASLAGTAFTWTDVQGADFTKANATDACFDDVRIGDGQCLTTLALPKGAGFSIAAADFNAAVSDLQNGGGVVERLGNSPENHAPAWKFVSALAKASEKHLADDALLEWALTNTTANKDLRQIVLARYLKTMDAGNQGALPWPEARPQLGTMMRIATVSLQQPQPKGGEWAGKNAGLIAQLVSLGGGQHAPLGIEDQRLALMEAYEKALPPAVLAAARKQDPNLFPLLSDRSDRVLLISPDAYTRLVSDNGAPADAPAAAGDAMYRLVPNRNAGQDPAYSCSPVSNITSDLAEWPLVKASCAKSAGLGWHGKLLDVLPFAPEHLTRLEAAIVGRATGHASTGDGETPALAKSTASVLTGDDLAVRPTQAHLKALLNTMPTARNDKLHQSYFVWSVAAALSRLSCMPQISKEAGFAQDLRQYAGALCNAAQELSPHNWSWPTPGAYANALLTGSSPEDLAALPEDVHERLRTEVNGGIPGLSFDFILETVWPKRWEQA